MFFEAPTAALWEYDRDDLLGIMEVSYAPNMHIRSRYYGADDWRKPWAGFTPTRYGAKAVREGRAATYLIFRKR